jgi:hypothetical protein
VTPPTEDRKGVNPENPLLEALDADSEEVARIVIKDRPEVAACLDGLVFRGQEDAMIPLLRAALGNMTASVLLDLEDEDAISACIADLKVQTERMQLAGKALDWEVHARRDPLARTGQRSAGYRAEIHELLHGPLPPLELVNEQEREVVVRRVEESLEREAQAGGSDAEVRIEELRAILEDAEAGTVRFPCFITKLSRPRLAEWLVRWSEKAFKATLEAASSGDLGESLDAELSSLRDIQERLHPLGSSAQGLAIQLRRPILPRDGS